MSIKGGHKVYRRQHEKALAKIVDRIADALIAEYKKLDDAIQEEKRKPESLETMAKIQFLSSRRYQTMLLKMEVKNIIRKSQNLLVATIVERLEN